jgi:hypothetical protein
MVEMIDDDDDDEAMKGSISIIAKASERSRRGAKQRSD